MDEEELDLRDFINVLLKWKKVIIGVTLVAVLSAGLLSYFVLPPIFKGSAIIQPPEIGLQPFISPSNVQAQIKSTVFIKQLSNELNIPFDELNRGISVSVPQNSNFIVVEFESKDKASISRFFESLLIELNNFTMDYENQINTIKNKILLLSKQLEILTDEQSSISKRLAQIEQGGKISQENFLEYYLLLDLHNSVLTKKMDLENSIAELNTQLENSHGFLYSSPPVILEKPVKPNKLLNIIIAGVASLFFSIFLAFFLEFIYGPKEVQDSEETK